jgi:predicted transcriptional regulator
MRKTIKDLEKQTSLENLLFESGLSIQEFADKVGVKKTTLEKQLYGKKNHIKYAFEYCTKLGFSAIKGYESGFYIELVIK